MQFVIEGALFPGFTPGQFFNLHYSGRDSSGEVK